MARANHIIYIWITLLFGYFVNFSSCDNNSGKQIQANTSILSSIGSIVPGVVTNVLPLFLMFGLGALLVPTLGLHTLLREAKQRSLARLDVIDKTGLMESVNEIFQKFSRAIENMEQKYN